MDPVYATMLDMVRIMTLPPTPTRSDSWQLGEEREIRIRETEAKDQAEPAAALAAARKPTRFRAWLRFRFSFMPGDPAPISSVEPTPRL